MSEILPTKNINRPRLGASACLLGERVRYDGGHQRDRLVTRFLGAAFEWVPVCPETEAGLGIPREPIRLVGDPAQPRVLGRESGLDRTAVLTAAVRSRLDDLAARDLRGFVFKSRSPSCGAFRLKVYDEGGGLAGFGAGLFARAFCERFPLIPVEEEGRLQDDGLRGNFITRVFAYDRLRACLDAPRTRAGFVAFHASEKLLLMAHSPAAYRELGRRVAAIARTPPAAFAREYAASFMAALERPATAARHVNVLQHVLGYFKRDLDGEDRRELLEAIEAYRRGDAPRLAPLALLKHHLRRHPHEWLAAQSYLRPHPLEFKTPPA